MKSNRAPKHKANPALTVNDDGANRSPDIHWPDGFTPFDADLFAHNEIFVHAPCSTVWQHIVEAPKWPAWYPNSWDVRIINGRADTLQSDSCFQFGTFGLHIDARIGEFVPVSRLGWFGEGAAINAYHAWLLIDEHNGCRVVTEEVAKGPAALAFRKSDPNAVHQGHDLWLKTLKILCEK